MFGNFGARGRRLSAVFFSAALVACAAQPPTAPTPAATPVTTGERGARLRLSPELRTSARQTPEKPGATAIASTSSPGQTVAPPAGSLALYFAAGSAAPTAEGRRLIVSLAQRLKENRLTTITLIGHSDNTGSAEFDIAMAQRRVAATADEFEKAGVLPRQIRRISYGNEVTSSPPCTSEACRQQERRVELRIDG